MCHWRQAARCCQHETVQNERTAGNKTPGDCWERGRGARPPRGEKLLGTTALKDILKLLVSNHIIIMSKRRDSQHHEKCTGAKHAKALVGAWQCFASTSACYQVCQSVYLFILFQTALQAKPCPPLKKYMRRVSAHIPLMMLTCTMGNCAHLTQSNRR